MTASIKTVEIFYSYSNEDEALRKILEQHLQNLQRQGFITKWHSRKITAGIDGTGSIDPHINTASLILLLISHSFIASDYSNGTEMQRAMERYYSKEARI